MNPNVGFRVLVALGFCCVFYAVTSVEKALVLSILICCAFVIGMIIDLNTER